MERRFPLSKGRFRIKHVRNLPDWWDETFVIAQLSEGWEPVLLEADLNTWLNESTGHDEDLLWWGRQER
jgi:hypothetical protein